MRNACVLVSLLAVLGLMAATPAVAAPKLIGSFGDWKAVTFDENGSKGCYATSEPSRKEGAYTQRGDVYALVTHRPAEKSVNVVSIVAGFSYQDGSQVTVDIGDEKFTLLTDQDSAWAGYADTAEKMIAAMKKAPNMVVHSVSARGTEVTDTYSLAGFSKAYKAIGDACGVQ